MKAMVLRASSDLALGDIPSPAPGPGQVLVRVTNSSVCGTDLKIFNGSIKVRHPLVMGHEMIGVVEEGYDGKRIRKGARVIIDPSVYCGECFQCRAGLNNLCPNGALLGRDANGGFAEYLTAPRTHVFPLPDDVESRTAPLIQVLTTCLHAQRQVNIFPGDSVVVLGLGVTGQLHIQLAKARGASVIGVTRSAWKRQLAGQLGADMTFTSGEAALSGVREATGGGGADLIIDSTGLLSVISDGVAMARLGAQILLYGITTVTEGALPFYQLYFKELALITARAAKGEDFPACIDLVRRGIVKLDPLVTHALPLAELGTAIDMLKSDADQRMKVVLENT